MKIMPRNDREDLVLDMSPMIDMVFLLLIFFIVASQIVDEKPAVEIPTAAAAVIPTDTTGRLMISVMKDDTFYIGSGHEKKTLEEVQHAIRHERALNEDLQVLIRADGDVKYRTNEQITLACAAVGANDIAYSVFEE